VGVGSFYDDRVRRHVHVHVENRTRGSRDGQSKRWGVEEARKMVVVKTDSDENCLYTHILGRWACR
jgi:hypothetical protein